MTSTTLKTAGRGADVDERGALFRLDTTLPLRVYLACIWAMRDFIRAYPSAALEAQNASSVLGRAWLVLNPLLYSAVYFLVFGVVLDGRRGIDNYTLYLVAGLFTFQFTARSVAAGTRAVSSNRSLIQSIGFPRAVLPISLTLGELYSHLYGLVVVILVAVATGERPRAAWLMIIPLTLLQTLLNVGLAFLVARAAFHVRDVEEVVPHAVRIWMYLSGVIFPIGLLAERVGGWAVALLEANPMWPVLVIIREALMEGRVSAEPWVVLTAWSTAVLGGGLLWFRAAEHSYGDV